MCDKALLAFEHYKKDNFAIIHELKKQMTPDELDEYETLIREYLSKFEDRS
jgi:hypothetical protein